MLQQNSTPRRTTSCSTSPQPQLAGPARCAARSIQAIDKQDLIDVIYGGFAEVANGPFSPGQDGYLDDNGLPGYDPDAAAGGDRGLRGRQRPGRRSTTRPRRPARRRRSPTTSRAAWGDIGVDVTQTPIEQSRLITNALLGSPDFEAFGWRNHAGLFVDTQNHWWHGFAADANGAEAKDGGVALNFGRLNDPVINDLLDQARSETDPAEPQGDRPGDQPAVRQGVLDPADVVDDVGHHHGPVGPEHRPRPAARRRRAPRSTAPASRSGLADLGLHRPS